MSKHKIKMSTRSSIIVIVLFGLLFLAGSIYAYVNTMRLRNEGVAVTATYVPDEENSKYIKHSSCGGKRSGGGCNYYVAYEYLDKNYISEMQGKTAQGSIIPSPYRHIPQPGEEIDVIVDPQNPERIYYAPYIYGNSLWVSFAISLLLIFGGPAAIKYSQRNND